MNIAARLIFRAPGSSILQLLKSLHWLTIEDGIKFKILNITWKAVNKTTPDYISNLLESHVPSRSLRSSNSMNLRVTRSRTRYGDRSFQQSAPKLWNTLPIGIRKQQSFHLFKRALKTYLFKNAYDCWYNFNFSQTALWWLLSGYDVQMTLTVFDRYILTVEALSGSAK